jgi:hypothetical protein
MVIAFVDVFFGRPFLADRIEKFFAARSDPMAICYFPTRMHGYGREFCTAANMRVETGEAVIKVRHRSAFYVCQRTDRAAKLRQRNACLRRAVGSAYAGCGSEDAFYQCELSMLDQDAGEQTMNEQRHIVSGIYTSRAEADSVRDRLVGRGLPSGQINIVENAGIDGNRTMAADNEALKDVLIDGALGAAAGTVIGGLGEVALVAANVTLFVASPLIAPLFMLGWGAFIGGFVGAAAGAEKPEEKKEGRLSDLVLDAIRSGHVVLVAQTMTAAETALARDLVGDSLAEQS